MTQEKKPELFINGELWTEAVDYFGTPEKAMKWFRTPNMALGGECPGEYCTKAYSGDREVLDIINRLTYGMTSDARAFAYANVELEGIKLTPQFKEVYKAFAENEISQLEAFKRLGIDIDQIPTEKRDELSKMFMNDLYKQPLEKPKR